MLFKLENSKVFLRLKMQYLDHELIMSNFEISGNLSVKLIKTKKILKTLYNILGQNSYIDIKLFLHRFHKYK